MKSVPLVVGSLGAIPKQFGNNNNSNRVHAQWGIVSFKGETDPL